MTLWTRLRNWWTRPFTDTGDRAVFIPAALMHRIRVAARADGTDPMHWVHRAVEETLGREGQ